MDKTELIAFHTEIRNKLTTAAEVTAHDVDNARMFAKAMPRPDHHVLYATVKRRYQEDSSPMSGTSEDDVVEQVTAEQVEDAKKASKANPSMENRVRYAVLKRQLEYASAGE